MNRLLKLFGLLMLCFSFSIGMTSCGDDEPDDPDQPTYDWDDPDDSDDFENPGVESRILFGTTWVGDCYGEDIKVVFGRVKLWETCGGYDSIAEYEEKGNRLILIGDCMLKSRFGRDFTFTIEGDDLILDGDFGSITLHRIETEEVL